MNTPVPSSPQGEKAGFHLPINGINGSTPSWEPKLASRMDLVRPSAIRQLLILGNDPNVISFGGGFPDAKLFPSDAIRASFDNVFVEQPLVALQYTATAGILPLRQEIVKLAQQDGMDITPDNVLVLQGGQQGLDLVCKMVCDRGDKVCVESPCFLGGLAAFNPYQPSYLPVDSDSDGILTDDLEATLKANPDCKFLYVVPDFSNPTGITMSLERRKALVKLAVEHDILILEDTPYRALRYTGEPIQTLYELCPTHVVHLGSFSKILAPGLRLGYAIAPTHLIEKLALLKMAADTQCSTVNQAAVAHFLQNNDMVKHIKVLRDAYRRKKEVMVAAIAREFPKGIQHTMPEGGLFLWATFPQGFDTESFLATDAIPAGVCYVPGRSFFAVESPHHHNMARISYSSITEEQIEEGIRRLGALLRKKIQA